VLLYNSLFARNHTNMGVTSQIESSQQAADVVNYCNAKGSPCNGIFTWKEAIMNVRTLRDGNGILIGDVLTCSHSWGGLQWRLIADLFKIRPAVLELKHADRLTYRRDPSRGPWIFKGDKNPSHSILLRGSKAVGFMS
jgi:hypothetical protein